MGAFVFHKHSLVFRMYGHNLNKKIYSTHTLCQTNFYFIDLEGKKDNRKNASLEKEKKMLASSNSPFQIIFSRRIESQKVFCKEYSAIFKSFSKGIVWFTT